MAGNPVSSAVSITGRPASRIARAVPPLETRSHPRSCSPRASSTTPVLSYTDSRALTSGPSFRFVVRRSREDAAAVEDGADRGGIEAALDLLDALVERVLGVAVEDGHGLLGEDRTGVDREAGDVDRRAGDLHPGGQR